jgi:hypothetical protein
MHNSPVLTGPIIKKVSEIIALQKTINDVDEIMAAKFDSSALDVQ